MFSNYTVKKVLPRLLAGAILINISIYLVALALDITNIIGNGVYSIIATPFSLASGGLHLNIGPLTSLAAIFAIVGIHAAEGFVHFLLMGVLLPALIIIIVVLVTLILRQAIILILVFVSPIAFALYCLPNTEQYFRKWWDTLFRALLIYPLIAALFAVGNILSSVVGNLDLTTGGKALAQILAVVALFAPLILIPFAFRMAGGLMGQMHNALHSKIAQPALSGMSKSRAAKRQANFAAIRENRRFSVDKKYIGGVNRRLNTALSSIADPGSAAKIFGGIGLRKAGINTNMGKYELAQISSSKMQASNQLGQKLNQMGMNDRALRELMGMEKFDGASLRAATARLRSTGNENDLLGAQQIEQHADYLTHINNDPEMGRASIQAAAGLAVTAQGFSNVAEIANTANKLEQSGEYGVAAAFVTQAQLNLQGHGGLDAKAGYGVQRGTIKTPHGEAEGWVPSSVGINKEGEYDPNAFNLLAPQEQMRATAHQIRRIQTTSGDELQAAKAGSVKSMSPGFEAILKAESDPGWDKDKQQLVYTYKEGDREHTVTISKAEVDRVASMVGQAQSPYARTSSSTSQAIQDIVDRAGIVKKDSEGNIDPEQNSTGRAYLSSKRDTEDPTIRGGAEAPKPPDGDKE